MLDQLVLARALRGSERQQRGVIVERSCCPRLLDRLRGLADGASDHDQGPIGPALDAVLDGEFQHRLVESDLADRELGRITQTARPLEPASRIVAADGVLRAAGRTCGSASSASRMRRDHGAVPQERQDRRRQIAPVESLVGGHDRILTQFRSGESANRARIVELLRIAQGHTHVASRRRGTLRLEPFPHRTMCIRYVDDEGHQAPCCGLRYQLQRNGFSLGYDGTQRCRRPAPSRPSTKPTILPATSSAITARAGWRSARSTRMDGRSMLVSGRL